MQDIRYIIEKCYSECPRSLELYDDFAGLTLSECVDNFTEKLIELDGYRFNTFEIDGELVGYYAITTTEIPFLYTFYVRPKFRRSEFVFKYWNKILEEIGDNDFMSGVYMSNLPARKFLTKNGGVLHINDNIAYYIFNRRETCL